MSKLLRDKIDASKIFNCRNFEPFIDSIVEILDYKGVSMSNFYICEIANVQFLTKLSFYTKSPPELYNRAAKKSIPQVDAEVMILAILKRNVIDAGISPCILELVYEKRCSRVSSHVNRKKCKNIKNVAESPYENVKNILCNYSDLISRGLAYDRCAFIVMERCDITLNRYLRKTHNTPIGVALFKSILFQIIYTFYAICKIYPKFRHYDLHDQNVMLKIDHSFVYDHSKPQYMKFEYENSIRYVPYFGIVAKIIDFGFSQIPEEGIVSVATDDIINMFYRSNNDLLFLFHWISRTTMTGSDKSGPVGKILSALDPTESYVLYQTERIREMSDKIPSYRDMATNVVFDEYLQHHDIGQIFGSYKV